VLSNRPEVIDLCSSDDDREIITISSSPDVLILSQQREFRDICSPRHDPPHTPVFLEVC
jgi:hypothetical protein